MRTREEAVRAAKSALRRARNAMLEFNLLLSEIRPNDFKNYIKETHNVSQSIAAMLIALPGDTK